MNPLFELFFRDSIDIEHLQNDFFSIYIEYFLATNIKWPLTCALVDEA